MFHDYQWVVIHDITKSINQSLQADMGILDIAKAFDKVSHRKLSRKMAYYGIQGATLDWVTDFLHGRSQQVVIDGETSESAEVTSGVPQWASVLTDSRFTPIPFPP